MLDSEIRMFAETEIVDHLNQRLNYHTSIRFKKIDARLHFIESPRMLGAIALQDDQYMISISLGWIRRTTILFQIIETMWATRSLRPKVYALNLGNAYDAFLFKADLDRTNFLHVPGLLPLFRDELDIARHTEMIDTFCHDFNISHGHTGNATTVFLDFALPQKLSCNVKRLVKICLEFLILHELCHIKRRHLDIANEHHLSITPEIANSLCGKSHLRKALEIDADIHAFDVMFTDLFSQRSIVTNDGIKDFFQTIFIFISSLDICAQSVAEYQAVGSTHPLPDIRAFWCVDYIQHQNRTLGEAFSNMLRDAFEASIFYCVRTFQQLCMPVGPFFFSANRWHTIDKQFFPIVFVVALLNDELSQIAAQLELVRVRNGDYPKRYAISFSPIGYRYEDFRRLAKDAAIAMFSKQNQITSEEQMISVVRGYFAAARVELALESGDHLIILQDQNKQSPLFPDTSESGEDLSDNISSSHHEYQRINHLAMKLLFELADVKISK